MNKEIKKIYKSLLEDIASGKLKGQDILPKEIELAATGERQHDLSGHPGHCRRVFCCEAG